MLFGNVFNSRKPSHLRIFPVLNLAAGVMAWTKDGGSSIDPRCLIAATARGARTKSTISKVSGSMGSKYFVNSQYRFLQNEVVKIKLFGGVKGTNVELKLFFLPVHVEPHVNDRC